MFLSEENIKTLTGSLQLPKALDGSNSISFSQANEMALQVYDMDSEGQAAERLAVTPVGTDVAVVACLVDRWNQQLARRIAERYEADFGPAVNYDFQYQIASYLGEAPLWSTGKTGEYADGAGELVRHNAYTMTSNRIRGRPLNMYRFIDVSPFDSYS
jgi:hypothetical protein